MDPYESRINDLWALLKAQGDANYIGESISQLEHSLQAADFAAKSGADNQTILAALLHDVGQFLPLSAKTEQREMLQADGTSVGKLSHETLGEVYLRGLGFSEKVSVLVGAHVVAKRYLTATEPGYYDALSSASKSSLKFQGGPYTPAEVSDFLQDPLWKEKVALRRWDDASKVVDWKGPGLEAYRTMGVEELRANWKDME